MKPSIRLTVHCAAVILCTTLTLQAGQGKGLGGRGGAGGRAAEKTVAAAVEFVETHGADLNLTADQKTQLDALKKKLESKTTALRNDADLHKLMAQLHQARQSGDEEKLKTLREQMRAEIEKKTGITKESVMDEIKKILTQDQLVKLGEIFKSEGGPAGKMGKGDGGPMIGKGGKGGGNDDHKAPDPAKGAPSLYDNEKPAGKPAQ